jgi:hypothetical protein
MYLMYAEAQMRKDSATNGSATTKHNHTIIKYINDLEKE